MNGVKALAEWKGHTLDLRCNRIGDGGAMALAKWKGHTLNLSRNNIGDSGVKALTKWPGTWLDLHCNIIGDERVKFISKWPVTWLDLGDIEVVERYYTSLIRKIGCYFQRDIQLYIIGKLVGLFTVKT